MCQKVDCLLSPGSYYFKALMTLFAYCVNRVIWAKDAKELCVPCGCYVAGSVSDVVMSHCYGKIWCGASNPREILGQPPGVDLYGD